MPILHNPHEVSLPRLAKLGPITKPSHRHSGAQRRERWRWPGEIEEQSVRMDCQFVAWAEKASQWPTRGDVRSVVRFGHIDRGWLPWSAVTCQVANALAAGNLVPPAAL